MSRWAAILDKLPAPLRDAALLDSVAAMDAQIQAGGLSAHFVLQCNYQDGHLENTKLTPPVVVFRLAKRTS